MSTVIVIGTGKSTESILNHLTDPSTEVIVVNTKSDNDAIDLTSKVPLSSLREALETFIFENGKFKKKWQS